jgi:outer membrane protein
VRRFLFLLLLLPGFLVLADDGSVETGQWHVSLALGYGQKSNPLVGGDDLSLVLLPDLAYYDDAFYFDNGDVGYTLSENDGFSFGLLTRLNFERAYFSFLHPANILTGGSSVDDGGVGPDDGNGGNIDVPTIDELSERKYAIDAGVQLNVYVGDFGMIRAEYMHDVSNVYKGDNALIEYIHQQPAGQWLLGGTVGLKYKSADLTDYYYGIDASDDVHSIFHYKGTSGIQPYVKISAIYPVSEKWQLITLARWSKLDDGMTDSPVVEEDSASTLYTGVSYAF